MSEITTNPPSILTVVWYNSAGQVRVTWENNATTSTEYTRVDIYRRVKGTATWGNPVRTLLAPVGTQAFVDGQSVQQSYEFAMTATSSLGGKSVLSSDVDLNRVFTPVPTFDTLTRDAPNGSLIQGWATWTAATVGVATVTGIIIEARRTGSGQPFTQVNQGPNTGSLRVPVTDGSSEWDVRLRAYGSAGTSDPTSVKVLEPWWQRPASVSMLPSSRDGSGFVVLNWQNNATERAPYSQIEIWRAPLSSGGFTRIFLGSGTRTTYTDTSSVEHLGYRYQVIPVNSSAERTPSNIATVTVQPGIDAPNAPGKPTVEYLAGDRIRVTWTATADADRYRVHALESGLTAPSLVSGTVSGALTWEFDAGPNWAGQLAVQAGNIAGWSGALSPWSDEIVTTPAGPRNVRASRTGVDVVITWAADSDTIAEGWEVERSTDGVSGWSLVADVTGSGVRQAVHPSASFAVAHHYRVRPRRTGWTSTAAEWVAALAPVPVGAAPDKPLPLTVGWVPLGEEVPLEWLHRPVDGSPQTDAGINWERYNPTTGAVIDADSDAVGSGESVYPLPPTALVAGFNTRWRVQTMGASSPAFSPWSDWAVLTPAARPVVSIITPSGTVTAGEVLVSWSAPVQQQARVRLLSADGDPLDVRTLSSAKSIRLPVEDRRSYQAEVSVFDGRLWSVPQVVAFDVEIDRPIRPQVTATAEGARVRLDVTNPAGLAEQRRNYALTRDMSDWTRNNVFPVAFQDGPAGVLLTYAPVPNLTKIHTSSGQVVVAFDARSDALLSDLKVSAVRVGGTLSQTLTVDDTWQRYEVELNGDAVGSGESPEVQLQATTGDGVYLRNLVLTSAATVDRSYFDGESGGDGLYYGTTGSGPIHDYHWEAVEAASPAEVDIVTPPVVRTELFRLDADGWRSIGDAVGGIGWDNFPALCVDETYRVRAWSTDSYSDSLPVTVKVEHRDSILSFGPSMGQQVTCGPIATPGSGRTRDREERLYAGHDYYTVYEAARRSPGRVRVDATLFPRNSSWSDWIDALGAAGDMVLRTPSGLVLRGRPVSDSWDPGTRYMGKVGFELVETGPRP